MNKAIENIRISSNEQLLFNILNIKVPSLVDSTDVVSTLVLGSVLPADPVDDTASVDSVVRAAEVAVATTSLCI